MRTRAETEAENRRVTSVKCPRCSAQPGRWCRTWYDQVAPKLHVARMRAAGVAVPESRVR